MKSTIVRNLKPEFEPVAVVFSDEMPDNALQFKKGKFGCILNLFASASKRGRICACSKENIACTGGRTALGFGTDLLASEEQIELSATIFSKGVLSARDKEAYRAKMEAAPEKWLSLYEFGERRHCSFEMAKSWLLYGMPRYTFSNKYVLFKPLSQTGKSEDTQVVVFPVNPIELSGLVTLLGSVVNGTDPVQVPQGADCFRITSFAYTLNNKMSPRGVLGMLDVDGRKLMKRRFRSDILTLAVPYPLYVRMEEEADESVFQIASWKELR